jgi:hypothetical protein
VLKSKTSADSLNPPRPPSLSTRASFLDMFSKITQPSQQQQRQDIGDAISSATDIDVKALPFKLEPSVLTFGLGSRQAPVDEDIVEELTLSNMSKATVHYAFRHANPQDTEGRCAVLFDPAEGVLAAGKVATVAAKLHVFCTTRFVVDVHVVAWAGDPK